MSFEHIKKLLNFLAHQEEAPISVLQEHLKTTHLELQWLF